MQSLFIWLSGKQRHSKCLKYLLYGHVLPVFFRHWALPKFSPCPNKPLLQLFRIADWYKIHMLCPMCSNLPDLDRDCWLATCQDSGLMNWGVSWHISSTLSSRAWCFGALFCWDKANNQKYVLLILLKITFLILQGKLAIAGRWSWQIYELLMSNFRRISYTKNH